MKRLSVLPVVGILALLLGGTAAASGPADLESARSLFQEGQFDRARTEFQRIREEQPRAAEPAYFLGRIALRRHNVRKARELLREAADRPAGKARHHYWLGRANAVLAKRVGLFSRAQYATEVKAQLEQALEMDPDHIHARVALVAYLLKAPGFLGGSREQAQDHIEELAGRSQLAALRCRGLLLEEAGERGRALALYRKAAEIAPERDRPHRWVAGTLREQGRYAQAFSLYQKRMTAPDPDLRAHYQFAQTAKESSKRLSRAEQALRDYLAQGPTPEAPSRADARILLGQILEKQDREEEAQAMFGQALSRAPNHPEAGEIQPEDQEAVRASIL